MTRTHFWWLFRAAAGALCASTLAAGCGTSDSSDGPNRGSSGSGGESALPDAGSDLDSTAGAEATESGDGDPVIDAATDDSSETDSDTATDAGEPPDAGPDGPTGPPICGDGWRDPDTEECDDQTASSPPDSCSADCRVEELPLLLQSTGAKRVLGAGRHPIAAGGSGFALAFVDYSTSPPAIEARLFGSKGQPQGNALVLDSGSTALATADPVIAALPSGKYAAVWTDLGADGDGWGVALRIVDGAKSSAGPRLRVNSTTAQNQSAADAIWTGSELVVAWEDLSQLLANKTDVRLRRFDATGKPLASEQTIAATAAQERKVSLAVHQGSWAAAWRSGDASGEWLRVRSGTKQWSIGPSAWAPDNERPALLELDATHLLVVFVEGGLVTGAPRLRGAILDAAAPGNVASFPIEPLAATVATDPALAQSQPALASVGNRIYLAWRSAAPTGAPEGEELWLKQLEWLSGDGSFTLDLSHEEIPLPRWVEHRAGDQELPALSAAPLWPSGALATTWVDWGQTFGSAAAKPEVIVAFVPAPVLRLSSEGGTGG